MKTFVVNKSKQPAYTLTLRSSQFELTADLPETFALNAVSDWESRLPGQDGGAIGETAKAFGVSGLWQPASQQVWVNSAPIEFPLTLLFDAQTDSYKEVYEPMTLLQSLVLPNRNNTGAFWKTDGWVDAVASNVDILFPPGPTIWDQNNRRVSLNIGKMLYLDSILVISVSNQWDTKLHKTGYPISGQSEITFRSTKTLSQEDYISMMRLQPTTAGGPR